MGILKIKVCGMRDPVNMEGILQAAPDYLGYIFYPKSKRYVGENPDPAIFECVPERTRKVAVFVNEGMEKVIGICNKYQIGMVQLHGSESPGYCREVRNKGVGVLKAFPVDEQFSFIKLDKYASVVDYFLFDTKGKLPGGTGSKFNWKLMKNYHLNIPFFLSGGIRPDDVKALTQFKHEQLVALDINSGFELSPALKDAGKITKFIEEIRSSGR